ncbi:hypothetical protein C0995_010848 [Termitomyces sp. Mi166|nr:hypothetical protein C0995_010848 [Termitomyces sp. Mi166\
MDGTHMASMVDLVYTDFILTKMPEKVSTLLYIMLGEVQYVAWPMIITYVFTDVDAAAAPYNSHSYDRINGSELVLGTHGKNPLLRS